MTDSGGGLIPRIDAGLPNRLTFAEVRRTLFRTKEGFFLFFGSLFGGIPAVIAVVMLVVAAKEARLIREGEVATGRVVARHISSSSKSTSYRVFYEFVATDGRTYGGDFSADRQEYYSLEEGSRLEIRYARQDPFDSAVVGHHAVPIQWVLPFLGIFIVTGSVFFVIGARGLRRRLRVLGKGLQVWGKNLGIREDPSMKVNNQPCRLLEFEYVDLTGRTLVGRSAYLSEKTIARLEGLDTVPIVYLADSPEDADLDLDRLEPRPLQ
jgi:hypothetical protein